MSFPIIYITDYKGLGDCSPSPEGMAGPLGGASLKWRMARVWFD